MSENRKRTKRRYYLNDFKIGADGKYEYRGKLYSFGGDDRERKRHLARLLSCCIVSLASAVLSEVFPRDNRPEGVFDFPVIFWLIQFLFAFLSVWATARIVFSGEPLREYVYLATVRRLPKYALVCAVSSALTLIAWIVYLLIFGFREASVAFDLVRPVGSAICCAVSFVLFLASKTDRWREQL